MNGAFGRFGAASWLAAMLVCWCAQWTQASRVPLVRAPVKAPAVGTPQVPQTSVAWLGTVMPLGSAWLFTAAPSPEGSRGARPGPRAPVVGDVPATLNLFVAPHSLFPAQSQGVPPQHALAGAQVAVSGVQKHARAPANLGEQAAALQLLYENARRSPQLPGADQVVAQAPTRGPGVIGGDLSAGLDFSKFRLQRVVVMPGGRSVAAVGRLGKKSVLVRLEQGRGPDHGRIFATIQQRRGGKTGSEWALDLGEMAPLSQVLRKAQFERHGRIPRQRVLLSIMINHLETAMLEPAWAVGTRLFRIAPAVSALASPVQVSEELTHLLDYVRALFARHLTAPDLAWAVQVAGKHYGEIDRVIRNLRARRRVPLGDSEPALAAVLALRTAQAFRSQDAFHDRILDEALWMQRIQPEDKRGVRVQLLRLNGEATSVLMHWQALLHKAQRRRRSLR